MKNLLSSLFLLIALLSSGCSEPETVIEPFREPGDICWRGFSESSDYIAVMGDVQSYTSDSRFLPYFKCTMRWVAEEVGKGAPVRGMLFTGDLTDNKSASQWNIFRNVTLQGASRILTVCCPGNHDYDWDRGGNPIYAIRDRESCHLSKFAMFPELQRNIVEYYETGKLDNIIVRMEINNLPIHIMSLEFSPRPEVLGWAERYLAEHPDERFLLLTHELLDNSGNVITGGSFGNMQFSPFGIGHSEPSEVADRLIYPFPNVIVAICGHNSFEEEYLIKRKDGGFTPILLFNLQYQDNGGNGMLELLEFPRGSEVMKVHLLSTVTGEELRPPYIYEIYGK